MSGSRKYPKRGRLVDSPNKSEWSNTCFSNHHTVCKNKYKPYCKCPCHSYKPTGK